MIRTEAVVNSWKTVRDDTAQAVADFPAEELDFKPVPELASFREIANHILVAGHALSGMLLDGVENFAVPEFREMLKKHYPAISEKPGKEELIDGLRQSIQERVEQLSSQSPEFYSKIIKRFDGQDVTRLEMVQTLKEHELTHRSQLFMYLRLKGIVPATTRRRQAKR